MNTIAYEIDGNRQELQFPDSFAEMTGEQLIVAARHLLSVEQLEIADLSVLTGVDPETLGLCSKFQLYKIGEMFSFIRGLNRSELSFKEWKVDSIRVADEMFYGPQSNFANVTWGEFIYVDQCYINGYHRAMVAAMFRPQRDNYDGETDRRIPFSTFGTAHRFDKLQEIDNAIITAVLINYTAMRRASLESAYPHIFPPPKPIDDTNYEADFSDANEETANTGSFSWTKVHRDLLGENIQDEEKYLQLNIHTVLNCIHQRIIDKAKIK